MDIKIGDHKFSFMPLTYDVPDRDLNLFLEQQDKRVIQKWYCDGTPSAPSPLIQKFKAETNLLLYAPLDPGVSPIDFDYKPSLRQKKEVARMHARIIKGTGLIDRTLLNALLQKVFGGAEVVIPWADIFAKFGTGHSVQVVSRVVYRRFAMMDLKSKEGRVILSVPIGGRHFVLKTAECTEDGPRLLTQFGVWFDATFEGPFTVPDTESARALRQEWSKWRKSEIKKQQKALKKETERLKEEEKALKEEGE